jgi:hypothetical protein
MKLITKNIRKLGIIGIIVLFILISVFLMLKYKNKIWPEKFFLSRTDYRIFACGEEISLKADTKSLITKRNGLFARSKPGSIIADGVPSSIDDILLTSFFDAAGGALEFSDEQKDILRIPTGTGLREFQSGDLCNGKKAELQVLHYRIKTSTRPWSVYSRIMWKYFDYVFTNNYSQAPPRDCLIFIFDSEDALERPWPYCASYEAALTTGELILER